VTTPNIQRGLTIGPAGAHEIEEFALKGTKVLLVSGSKGSKGAKPARWGEGALDKGPAQTGESREGDRRQKGKANSENTKTGGSKGALTQSVPANQLRLEEPEVRGRGPKGHTKVTKDSRTPSNVSKEESKRETTPGGLITEVPTRESSEQKKRK